MQKSQPAKILLQKLWKRSSSWTRLRLNPVADLKEKLSKVNNTYRNWSQFLMIFAILVPFDNPDETEEQVGYSDQQVGQRQIIRGVWKVYFVRLVVAVEKIGLFQKALQIKHKRWVRKPNFFSRPGTIKCEVHRLTPPDSRSVMCSWKITRPRRVLLGYRLHTLPVVKHMKSIILKG